MIRSILTITEPAEDRLLATVAAVREQIADQTTPDDVIRRHVEAASGAIEAYCRRVFAAESLSEAVRLAAPQDTIVLRRVPVLEVTEVAEDGSVLDSAAWELEPSGGLLARVVADGRPARWTPSRVVVTYRAGYETIPADVSKAVAMLVAGYWAGRGRDPALRSESIDGLASYGYALAGGIGGTDGSLSSQVARLLEPYVMWSVV